MKYTIKKVFYLDCTLDSSETVMFNKGGKYKIDLTPDIFDQNYDKIEISIQMDRNEQYRHDFITKSASEAILRREKEQEEDNEDKSS